MCTHLAPRRICACLFLVAACTVPAGFAQESQLQLNGPNDAPQVTRSSAGSLASREFEGVGTLQRVKRNDTGSMRFALLDRAHKILAFVAPTSKFELQALVGQEVALTGRTLTQQDDIAPYVMIEEIADMTGARVARMPRTPVEREIEQASYDFEALPAAALASHEQPAQGYAEPTTFGEPAGFGYNDYMMPTPAGGPCESCGPCDTCDPCNACGQFAQTCTSCGTYQPCGCCDCSCGPPGWLWLRGEYLLWWTKGMDTPPLITTSPAGTPIGDAGVLGTPGVEILYGNDEILTDARSGYRIRFGGYLGPCRRFGWLGEYFSVTESDAYAVSSDGNGLPIIARPFFNVNPRDAAGNPNPPAGNDSELVSFPDVLRGEIRVDSDSQFQGAAGRLRYNICCKEACGGCTSPGYGYRYGCAQPCGYPAFCRVDLTAGYRYYGLDESLTITEDLTSLQSANPGRFEITDRFETRNDFNGGELGMMIESGVNRWTLDCLMRIAIGGVKQEASISGETTISPLTGPAETFSGGLLAQNSNIGTYSRDEFTMAPEINANLGFYLTPRFRALVGYTFIYWGNVLRPGDQIDLDVNPDQLPPPLDPIEGPLRPEYVFRQTDFWAHGLNVSLDLRW